MAYRALLIFTVGLCTVAADSKKPPHIIFILADDLGWNDVGWHGNSEIPTPNIDALALSGLILNRYYSLPICTPSRAAFLTGKYPIRMGMQHGLLKTGEPRGLPLTERILPEYLSSLAGYSCHLVGKWHLGYLKKEYTPTHRGFLSHLGYWNGYQDYFDHSASGPVGPENHTAWGLDMRRNMEVAYDLHGEYSTDIFTQESVSIIENHNKSTPLFLFVSQIAPHTGSTYNQLPLPDEELGVNLDHIKDHDRRKYAGMVYKLDQGIGQIVAALQRSRLLNDSLIIFASDNGGPVKGYMGKSTASNWPFKGTKRTLWEGGVRLAAAVWSRNLPNAVSDNLFHSTDWTPTLLSAAGVRNANLTGLDGIDQWDILQNVTASPVRDEILLNYDTVDGHAAIIDGKWKLIKGSRFNGKFDKTFGTEHSREDFIKEARSSVTGITLGLSLLDMNESDNKFEAVKTTCSMTVPQKPCNLVEEKCLFNVFEDPCENNNVAAEYPEIVKKLDAKLEDYKEQAVPASNVDIPECVDPAYSNYVWTTFADDGQCRSRSIRNFSSLLTPFIFTSIARFF